MSYKQILSFDLSKGGNVPNLCLDNVRRGYGIPNKYSSAWEAWQHTQQHADLNMPDGLAIPLYYSYTATIDNITKNYGHINVRLPDGRVWSDGNIYQSIDAYTANHYPKFVGWGESVNDFKIIQEVDMSKEKDLNADDIRNMMRWANMDPYSELNNKYVEQHKNDSWNDFIYDFQKQAAVIAGLQAKFGGPISKDQVMNYLNAKLT